MIETLWTMAPYLQKLTHFTLHLGVCSQAMLISISRCLSAAEHLDLIVLSCNAFQGTAANRQSIPAGQLAKAKRMVFTLPVEGPACVVDCLEAFPAVERCMVSVSSVAHVALRSHRLKRVCIVNRRPHTFSTPNISLLDAPHLEQLIFHVDAGVLYFENACSVTNMRLVSPVKVTGRVTVKMLVIERSTCLLGMDLRSLHVDSVMIEGGASPIDWDSILFQLAGPNTKLTLGEEFFKISSLSSYFDTGRLVRHEGFSFKHITVHVRGLPEADVLGSLFVIGRRCPTTVICHYDHRKKELLSMTGGLGSPVFLTCQQCSRLA